MIQSQSTPLAEYEFRLPAGTYDGPMLNPERQLNGVTKAGQPLYVSREQYEQVMRQIGRDTAKGTKVAK